VRVQGAVKSFIVDTGSSISLAKPGLFDNQIRRTNVSPYGATGDKLKVEGELEAKFSISNNQFEHTFIVCDLPTEAHGFLGIDFLIKNDGCLNLGEGELRLRKPQARIHGVGVETHQDKQSFPVLVQPLITRVTVKLPSEENAGKEGRSKKQEQVLLPQVSTLVTQSQWIVSNDKTIKLSPRAKHVVGKLDLPKNAEVPEMVCIEPMQLPCDGILAARSSTRVLSKHSAQPATAGETTLQAGRTSGPRQTSRCAYVNVMVANFSEQTVELQKSAVLGVAEKTTVNQIEECNSIVASGSSPDDDKCSRE
jgi:hypothetical protein